MYSKIWRIPLILLIIFGPVGADTGLFISDITYAAPLNTEDIGLLNDLRYFLSD